MSLITKRFWRCDCCGAERQIKGNAASPAPPPGWTSHDHGYGLSTEVCSTDECLKYLAAIIAGAHPYGTCPECGAACAMRERRPGGNDTCVNGHVYPSSEAVK